jgi:lysophospholipase L1-like esterase
MKQRRSLVTALALLSAQLAGTHAPTISAQAMAAAAMVDNPCPEASPDPPELKSLGELMLKPEETDPAVIAKLMAPVAAAYAKSQSEQRERDWPNLCRYRVQNAESHAGTPRVVFMGDSITEFWLPADPGFFNNGVVNRGIGGQTSPQMLLRFYSDVIALHPKVVHILAGTNDIAGNTGPTTAQDYKNNIMAMTDIALGNGIKVVLGSIPPSDHFAWRPGLNPAGRITELNAWLQSYAAKRKLIFVDYHTALSGPGGAIRADLSHDGVHPHRSGYAVMKPLAERAIAQALGQSP